MSTTSTTLPGYYTRDEAAARIGVCPSMVSRYFSTGRLTPITVGNVQLIPQSQVESFKRVRPGPRAKKK